MSVTKIERLNRYDENVKVFNNLRAYTNPLGDSVYPIPLVGNEIVIENLLLCYEDEILPYFERFGPVYKLLLLTNGDILATASLTYYLEKSVHAALDVARYYIRKGTTLNATKSEEVFHLLADNIAPHKSDKEIESQLESIFSSTQNVTMIRQEENDSGLPISCIAKMEFRSLTTAMAAFKVGPIILWGKKVTLEWDDPERRDYLLDNEVSYTI